MICSASVCLTVFSYLNKVLTQFANHTTIISLAFLPCVSSIFADSLSTVCIKKNVLSPAKNSSQGVQRSQYTNFACSNDQSFLKIRIMQDRQFFYSLTEFRDWRVNPGIHPVHVFRENWRPFSIVKTFFTPSLIPVC